jgi:hypothetical protein
MDWRNFLFWQKPTQPTGMLNYEILASGTDIFEEEQLVVDELRKAGADLSQPREVLHYFYFPSEPNAEIVAAELRLDGFRVEDPLQIAPVEETPNPWRVRAVMNVVVAVESAQALTNRFRALASSYGGEYDGWEAAAKP